jgi:4-hydroxy-4-methyl-2-oxoglutarate aldolase
MIKDPPLLTIRRRFARPADADLKSLAAAPTGYLVDAMGGSGALSQRIKPLGGALSANFCGPALTCHCGPSDNLALAAALALAEAGDVLVVGTDAFEGAAVVGDLLLAMAKNRGVAALVTDGLVRDLDGIDRVGLPVHCAGVTPNSPARNGPGSVGLPTNLGGLSVDAGDIIRGDRDGVVVVPSARLAEVLAELPAIRAAEAEMEARVEEGLQSLDFVEPLLASDQVRFVD